MNGKKFLQILQINIFEDSTVTFLLNFLVQHMSLGVALLPERTVVYGVRDEKCDVQSWEEKSWQSVDPVRLSFCCYWRR